MHVARSSGRTCVGATEECVAVMSLGYVRMTATMPALAERLRQIIPADAVIDDPATLLPYAYDASFWSLRQRRMPEAVVVPESTAEVVSVVRVANETGTPI